jgi:hypothetical protein
MEAKVTLKVQSEAGVGVGPGLVKRRTAQTAVWWSQCGVAWLKPRLERFDPSHPHHFWAWAQAYAAP